MIVNSKKDHFSAYMENTSKTSGQQLSSGFVFGISDLKYDRGWKEPFHKQHLGNTINLSQGPCWVIKTITATTTPNPNGGQATGSGPKHSHRLSYQSFLL